MAEISALLDGFAHITPNLSGVIFVLVLVIGALWMSDKILTFMFYKAVIAEISNLNRMEEGYPPVVNDGEKEQKKSLGDRLMFKHLIAKKENEEREALNRKARIPAPVDMYAEATKNNTGGGI